MSRPLTCSCTNFQSLCPECAAAYGIQPGPVMRRFDVYLRVTVFSVEAANCADAHAQVEKWIDETGAALPGSACPSVQIESCEEVDN